MKNFDIPRLAAPVSPLIAVLILYFMLRQASADKAGRLININYFYEHCRDGITFALIGMNDCHRQHHIEAES